MCACVCVSISRWTARGITYLGVQGRGRGVNHDGYGRGYRLRNSFIVGDQSTMKYVSPSAQAFYISPRSLPFYIFAHKCVCGECAMAYYGMGCSQYGHSTAGWENYSSSAGLLVTRAQRDHPTIPTSPKSTRSFFHNCIFYFLLF